MFEEESQNYYDILDIKPDATLNDVRQAYYRTKQAYSRDSAALYSLFDEAQTKRMLERVEEAFIVLSNPEKRKEYDRIHGFLSPEQADTAPTRQLKAGSFSFETGLSANPSPGNQGAPETGHVHTVADEMAKGVFAGFDALEQKKPAPSGEAQQSYATPRTLAESNDAFAASKGMSSWDDDPAWKANQNKLGIVRRVDLIKAFAADAAMETAITEEKEFSGEFLKKVREYRKINLDELAEFTKISKNYLTAVENEAYASLPAAVYVRGFVFQIAKTLKLPHDKAATGYMNRYKSHRK